MMTLAAALISVSSLALAADKAAPAGGPEQDAPLAMPKGVVLKLVRIGQLINVPGSSSSQPREFEVFANPERFTYYTYDRDPPGKSTCVDECAAKWPAATPPEGAQPVGEWSIITRDDGAKQWAFRGKPLYTSKLDNKGEDSASGAYFGKGGASGDGVDGVWHIAEVNANKWLTLPAGIATAEALMAPGQVLVNGKGRTLYAFDGDVKQDKAVLADWTPVEASQLDLPVGDFTVLARGDGLNQWAFKGRALYTYTGDEVSGDVNGRGVDRHFQVAMVARYFTPAEVAIQRDQRRGGVLTAALTGRALYARDRAIWNGTGAHYARGNTRGNPGTGMAIGLTGCDAECEKTWEPLKAPADAGPWGNWTVFSRPDGSKQWAYQGYALYTNNTERPGEIVNNDTYEVSLNHDTVNLAPANRGFAIYWRVTAP
jgi:predicted lipoprotein with Yx(FWY)xxD motif